MPFGAAAAGHQLANARVLAKAKAAVAIGEAALSAENLAGTLVELFETRDRLVAMGLKAKSLARPDAAKELARLVLEAERTR